MIAKHHVLQSLHNFCVINQTVNYCCPFYVYESKKCSYVVPYITVSFSKNSDDNARNRSAMLPNDIPYRSNTIPFHFVLFGALCGVHTEWNCHFFGRRKRNRTIHATKPNSTAAETSKRNDRWYVLVLVFPDIANGDQIRAHQLCILFQLVYRSQNFCHAYCSHSPACKLSCKQGTKLKCSSHVTPLVKLMLS